MFPINARRRLLRHGMTLFFLGLMTGFVIPAMTNPRGGLAAHLEGVMNGTFLVAVGLAWSDLHFPKKAAVIAYWLLLFGTYANWATTTASGVFGTHSGTEIAAAGHHGSPWQEQLVFAAFAAVGVTMVVALGLVVWGAWRREPDSSAQSG